MAYLALYRKYRPQTFAEVVGQDHVTATLAREVTDGKVAHAYLFSGPRGTGKTTTARILAKALNCQHRGADGEPCNRCESCVGITEASSLDVIELDAASHNKVEDVREIRVNAGTVASMGGAKRIYILDEAHMLSRAASNALLKILEEPPEHVHFVLATTEPYKLPDTIRSRAQHFDFHPISRQALRSHIEAVAAREGHSLADDATALIVDHADGSARDALSLLEQVAALGEGKVEVGMVTRALGLADRQVFERLARAIEEGDAPAALELVAAMAAQGSDLRRFVAEALGFFRGIFLAQYAPNVDEIVDESSETVDAWRQIARTLDSGDVLRAIDQLSDALGQLRDGREERLVVELALLRLTRPETAFDSASLATRLDRLEERMRKSPTTSGDPAAAPVATVEPVAAPQSTAAPTATTPTVVPESAVPALPAVEAPMAEGLSLEGVELVWPALVARVRDATGPRRHALFREATPTAVAEPATIVLGVPAHLPFHLEQLRADLELQRIAVGVAGELLGGRVSFEFEAADNREQAPDIVEAEEAGKQRAPDSAQMAVAPEAGDDPTGLILQELGGSVVAED